MFRPEAPRRGLTALAVAERDFAAIDATRAIVGERRGDFPARRIARGSART